MVMPRKIIIIGVIIGLLSVLTIKHPTRLPARQVFDILEIGGTNIAVEIVDTPATRTRGLSGRAILAENTGMLFIFDRADYHSFWMKEMNFPIDIIWLDDNWRIVDLTENISPNDFPTTYRPRAPARYVLEVNTGFIATHQIITGSQAILK